MDKTGAVVAVFATTFTFAHPRGREQREQSKSRKGKRDKMEKIEQQCKDELEQAAKEYLETATSEGDRAEMKVRSMSPLLSYFSIVRQEKVLDTIRKQSDSMRRHSWIMIIMTGAILLLSVIQIITMIMLFQRSL